MTDMPTIDEVCAQDSVEVPNVAPIEIVEYGKEVPDGGDGE